METIIGLGSVGCKIAKVLEEFNIYDVLYLDSKERDGNSTLLMVPAKVEEYEEMDFSFLKSVKTDVLLIVSGVNAEAAAALNVLSNLQHCKIHVLYIRPELDFLYGQKQLLEKTVFRVLQEYARSAKFERIILADNSLLTSMEDITGELPIIGYYDKVNETIAHAIHSINICDHQTPIMGRQESRDAISRIATIGVKDIEQGEEKRFFSLEHTREVWYYYVVNQDRLKTDGGLFRTIKAYLRKRTKQEKIKFGIYETTRNVSYCYSLVYSSIIQDLELPKTKREK